MNEMEKYVLNDNDWVNSQLAKLKTKKQKKPLNLQIEQMISK